MPVRDFRISRVALLTVCVIALTRGGQAQLAPLQNEEPVSEAGDRVRTYLLDHLPSDPTTASQIDLVQELIDDGQISSALEALQLLLYQQPDQFLPQSDAAGNIQLSTLRQEIEQVILKHRPEYERLVGAQAEQLLTAAIAGQDLDALLVIVRRYELCDAGARALAHLAQMMASNGEPGLAARLYDRLSSHPRPQRPPAELSLLAAINWRRAGLTELGVARLQKDPAAINRYLAEHRNPALTPGAESQWLEQVTRIGPSAQTSPGLNQWRTPHGGIDQDARVDFAPPLLLEGWQVPLVDEYDLPPGGGDPDILSKAEEREQLIRNRDDVLAFPAAVPLIVNGNVLVNRYGGVRAYDLRNGALRWPGVFVDNAFEDMFISDYSPIEPQGEVNQEMEDLFFTQRGWRDATAMSLSADDDTVYALVNCNLYGAIPPSFVQGNQSRSPRIPDRQNLLLAYELKTGRLRNWPLGEQRLVTDENLDFPSSPVLGDVFYFSAPLPVHGRLYCIGEERGQVQLFEFDPATGLLQWSLPLLNPDEDLLINESRRLSGLMPAYRDGLLICPTGAGVLTAVDIIHRRLVWSTAYTAIQSDPMQGRLPALGRFRSRTAAQTAERFLKEERWLTQKLLLTKDRVVFSPPDSQQLVCLRLLDGERVWPASAQPKGIHLAGVHSENAILVDQHSVTAIQLENGMPAWTKDVAIPVPSGSGVIMGDVLLQPVVTGGIVAVNLSQGRWLAEIPMPAGFVAGNLAGGNGRILTQTGTRLALFLSAEETWQRLEQHLTRESDRPAALYTRALFKLISGDEAGGIDDLRESLALRSNPQVRNQLVDTLLSGLKTDYPRYSAHINELEQLVDTPEQLQELLRIQARGLISVDRSAALRTLLRLLTELPTFTGIQNESGGAVVRDDCWLLGAIQDVLGQATKQELPALKEVWKTWLDKTLFEDPERLVSLIRHMPKQLIPEDFLPAMIPAISAAVPANETGLVLQPYLNADDPVIRSLILRELAQAALTVGDGESFVCWESMLQKLAVEFPLGPNTLAVQDLHAWKLQPTLQEQLSRIPQWPRRWTVGVASGRSVPPQQLYPIPVFGPPSVELSGWTFGIDSTGSQIHVFDSSGRFRRSIPTQIASQRVATGLNFAHYVSMNGSRACFVLVDRFLLCDLIDDTATVQTHRSLLIPDSSPYQSMTIVASTPPPLPGIRVPHPRNMTSQPAGRVGPFSGSILCYSYEDHLVAIDIATNEEIWRRPGIPRGAEVLGDLDYTVVMHRDSSELQLFRTLDGHSLGSRPVPAEMIQGGWRRADWGRMIPATYSDGDRFYFHLVDPVTGADAWRHEFAAGTLWAPVDNRDLAFLSPDGTCTLVAGMTGRQLVQTKLPLDSGIAAFRVVSFPEHWLILTSTDETEASTPHRSAPEPFESSFRLNGTVVCLDRGSGEVRWSKTVSHGVCRLDQPGRWPLLLYSEIKKTEPPVGAPMVFAPNTITAVALDRFTGEEVGRQQFRDDPTERWLGVTDPAFEIHYRLGLKTWVLVPVETDAAPPVAAPPQND